MAVEERQTDKKPTSRQHEEFCLSAILRIAAAANVTLPRLTQVTYLEALLPMSRERMELATQRTILEWAEPSKMPPVKFIRDRSGSSPELEAEQAWEWTLLYVRRFWHIDVGPYPDAPKIPPAIDYAIRQAGGLSRIAYHSDQVADFVRKGFLEAHVRYTKEGGAQTLMSRELAASMIKQIQAAAKEIPGAGDK